MYTIGYLTEQVQLIYKRAIGSEDNTSYVLDAREVAPIINQVVNEMLSITIQNGIKNGDLNIPPSTIVTYELREPQQDRDRWYVNIPYYPINLPRNMGIWHVCSQTCTNPGEPFENVQYQDEEPMIPIGSDDWDLLRSTGLHESGLFEDQIGYYVEGNRIFFTSAPPETEAGPFGAMFRFVKIKLLVTINDTIGDATIYPIPIDMVTTVINRVLDILKMNTSRQQEAKQQDR